MNLYLNIFHFLRTMRRKNNGPGADQHFLRESGLESKLDIFTKYKTKHNIFHNKKQTIFKDMIGNIINLIDNFFSFCKIIKIVIELKFVNK